MSKAMFVESLSEDATTRAIAHSVVRVLNDPMLERWQRAKLIAKLQSKLTAHQELLQQRADKKQMRKQSAVTRTGANPTQADIRSVIARHRELRGGQAVSAVTPQVPETTLKCEAANDSGRRKTLHLQKRDLRLRA